MDTPNQAVLVDLEVVEARVVLDPSAQTAAVEATAQFTLGGEGRPVLDLRQQVDSLGLDGRALPGDGFAPVDLGGGPGATMRMLDRVLAGGSRHRLELRYRLAMPDAEGADPLGWSDGAVRWDFSMSDLHPGRYLEMWLPANLCHDRFQLKLEVLVESETPHSLLTNGTEYQCSANEWWIDYPSTYTSLSPMLVLRPSDEIEQRRHPGTPEIVTAKVSESDADLEANEADIKAWLTHNQARYGKWVHGDRFTAVLWGAGRGMEYDGATTAAVGAVEHEVFHSWFGRGIKPATASDGWIDEAWTSWATSSRRREVPRHAVEELTLEEPPVVLCPPHPWSRYTPVESYKEGSRLFAGIAHLLGGAPQMRQAMATWYQQNAGGFVTTSNLERHLGPKVGPLFRRYVHGREERK